MSKVSDKKIICKFTCVTVAAKDKNFVCSDHLNLVVGVSRERLLES
jgi:hypothetical protein